MFSDLIKHTNDGAFVCSNGQVGPNEQAAVKRNYRIAQFHATMHCIIGDATASFVPLLGIQMAPLLMTLVRKGLITSYTYHRVYAAALYVPYAVATLRLVQGTFGVYKILWYGNVTMLLVSQVTVPWQ
jgi:hypothetical protein